MKKLQKLYTKRQFCEIVDQFDTMAQAAHFLNIPFSSFARFAKDCGCYNPNQSGRGLFGLKDKKSLEKIVSNEVTIKTWNLKRKLLHKGIKKNICENCGLDTYWNGNPINLELHHIDGNRKNNELSNLQLLCPNCHSQTENYRNRKKVAALETVR